MVEGESKSAKKQMLTLRRKPTLTQTIFQDKMIYFNTEKFVVWSKKRNKTVEETK